MKAAIAFVAIALIVIVWAPQSEAEPCNITCNSNNKANACGMIRGTNTCRTFRTMCAYKAFNCDNNNKFKLLDIRHCSGIAVGTKGICRRVVAAAPSTPAATPKPTPSPARR